MCQDWKIFKILEFMSEEERFKKIRKRNKKLKP